NPVAAEARPPQRALDGRGGHGQGARRRPGVPARAQPIHLHSGRDAAPPGEPHGPESRPDRGAVRRLFRRGRHRPPRRRVRPALSWPLPGHAFVHGLAARASAYDWPRPRFAKDAARRRPIAARAGFLLLVTASAPAGTAPIDTLPTRDTFTSM